MREVGIKFESVCVDPTGREQLGSNVSTSDHPFLHPTRIDIPLEIRAYAITLLQQTLACTIDLRSQVKQAAWNLKGTDVFPLQTLFTTIAIELDNYIDLVAARITALGGVARGTVRMAVAQSKLPEYPEDLVAGMTHVRALAERLAFYATAIRADIVHATDIEEVGTANLYIDLSRGIETRLGELDAYLS
jgi:starvation-inducible DNA-binding protein